MTIYFVSGSTPCSHHSYTTHHGYYLVQPVCPGGPQSVHAACSVYSGKDSCSYSSVHMPTVNGGCVISGGSTYDGSSSVMLACRTAAPHTPTSSRSERSFQGSSRSNGRYENVNKCALPVRL